MTLPEYITVVYMNPIYKSGVLSLIVQVLTGLFDIYVLMLPFEPRLSLLKNLLKLELFVQIIEGAFYVWLVTSFASIGDITKFRYYDWVITTPTMLFSYCMYLVYLNTGSKETDLLKVTIENTPTLVPIFILNTLMLLAGYLAETGRITHNVGAILGFIPFFAFFYLIYDNFAKFTNIGKITFWYFSGIWSLYGVASILSYKYKNTIYNVLDLFAKNFFGIFLAVVLLMSR